MRFLEPHRQRYLQHREAYNRQRDWLKEENERFRQQRPPSWVEYLVTPLAEELVRHFPDSKYKISGPFGLSARVHISLYHKDADEHAYPLEEEGWLGLVVLVPTALMEAPDLCVVDLNENTGRYAPGTLGEMNGLNNPTHPLPDTIEELIEKYFGR